MNDMGVIESSCSQSKANERARLRKHTKERPTATMRSERAAEVRSNRGGDSCMHRTRTEAEAPARDAESKEEAGWRRVPRQPAAVHERTCRSPEKNWRLAA